MLLYSLLVTQYIYIYIYIILCNFINKMKVFTIIMLFLIYKYCKITSECIQNIFLNILFIFVVELNSNYKRLCIITQSP